MKINPAIFKLHIKEREELDQGNDIGCDLKKKIASAPAVEQ